jgi:hypothetical protein
MPEKSEPALTPDSSKSLDSYLQRGNVIKFATVMNRISPFLNMMSFDERIVILIVGIIAAHGG